MGILLTPIIVKQHLALDDLRAKRVAVDTNGELYQFLALIRLRDGSPLKDSHGRITSHLSGLFYRTTRLITDYGMELAFVFDGKPPAMKFAEIARRRAVKEKYDAEHAAALEAGDLEKAYSKATMTSRLTRDMADEARELLRLMGLPVIQAPSEGEAQASHMAARESVWAAASKDYDCLLFGTPRLVRSRCITTIPIATTTHWTRSPHPRPPGRRSTRLTSRRSSRGRARHRSTPSPSRRRS